MPLSPDALFAAANSLAAVGWLVLAVSPAAGRWAPALRRLVSGVPGSGSPVSVSRMRGSRLRPSLWLPALSRQKTRA
jgi:hypothetical protein